MILAKDSHRLYALITSAIRIHVHSKAPLFTEDQKLYLKEILCRFCAEIADTKSECVEIEGLSGSISVNKNILMLFCSDYVQGMFSIKGQDTFEKIISEGLLEDGMVAVSQYFRSVRTKEMTRDWSPSQALQVLAFFKQMSCESFDGKDALIELVGSYSNFRGLREEKNVFGNPALMDMLLAVAESKLQEADCIIKQLREFIRVRLR